MKVHANAPLGPKGRLTMVRRVVEQGWSLTEAAEAAGVSERTCSKWVARYRAEGEAGLLDRSSAPRSIPHRTPDELRRGDRRAAPAADDRRGDRRVPGDGALDGLGGAEADRAGQALRLEPPEPPNRYERRQPGELIHIDVKKLGRDPDGAGHRVTGHRAQPDRQPPTPPARRARRAGSSCTSASTTPPAWPTSRSSPTRRPPPPSASCSARSPSTPPRHHRRARDDRQRRRLPLDAPRPRLPRAGHPPPPHPPLPAPHQRQGRALHPHPARPAGPTARSTAPAANAPPPLTAGSGPTTIAAHTAPSATSRPSPASTS